MDGRLFVVCWCVGISWSIGGIICTQVSCRVLLHLRMPSFFSSFPSSSFSSAFSLTLSTNEERSSISRLLSTMPCVLFSASQYLLPSLLCPYPTALAGNPTISIFLENCSRLEVWNNWALIFFPPKSSQRLHPSTEKS